MEQEFCMTRLDEFSTRLNKFEYFKNMKTVCPE